LIDSRSRLGEENAVEASHHCAIYSLVLFSLDVKFEDLSEKIIIM
jgi:hypothetical protein